MLYKIAYFPSQVIAWLLDYKGLGTKSFLEAKYLSASKGSWKPEALGITRLLGNKWLEKKRLSEHGLQGIKRELDTKVQELKDSMEFKYLRAPSNCRY